MKFTLSWLRDHLDTDAPLSGITDTLTMIGLELESLTNPAAPLADFRVAHVLTATQHPNADRLRVCEVDTGQGIATVVCGAPNAVAGMKAVFAPPGSTIPATGAVLKIGEIRGIASNGMLLSRREMGLGDEHDGILALPDDAPVGTPYPAYAGIDDPVIEIAVTPNRGDALSVRGIARDLAAAQIGRLLPWTPPQIEPAGQSAVRWINDWPEACPYILGRTIRGVRNPPSPAFLANRLRAVGLRPISTLVDITNYFALDLGRPLHVFDVHKLHGDLTIRRGANESFRALDGRDYTARHEDCVIADPSGVLSLAGVIGGAATGCDEHTTEVFVECALFDPIRVALTGRHHQVTSDARQRFERGIDPDILPAALDAATAMIIDLCGGVPSAPVAAGHPPHWRRAATLDFARLDAIAGEPIPPDDAAAALERLGFAIAERDAASLTVRVPSWRNDIAAPRLLHPAVALTAPALTPERLEAAAEGCNQIEPQADLAEEILRLRGLDRIPATSLPSLPGTQPPSLTPRQQRTALARRVLASHGLLECVTFSFTDAANAALFGGTNSPTIANPIAADLSHMRPTPLATIAQAASRNAARGLPQGALFEIGPGFTSTEESGQHRIAAGLRFGAAPRHWSAAATPPDAFAAKADALAVLAALSLPMDSLSVTQDAPPHYHPGRAGTLRQGPKLILAHFGELHPALLTALDLPPTIAFELYLDAIPDPKRRRRPALILPSLQPVRRDYAFAAPPDTSAETLLRAARTAERTLITAATLFDRFDLPDGRISLGVEITLQPTDHTLTEPELEAVSQKIIAAVIKATGAVLR
jgi:phenylalanyl-tRNA synthetase beta chain